VGLKKQTGSDLTRQCLDYLTLRGVFAFRVNTTGVWDPVRKVYRTFQGLKGVSDILGLLPLDSPFPGRMLAVEVKAGRDVLSEDQRYFLDTVNDNGGLAFAVRSLDDLIAALTAAGLRGG
jgi:hypothetical protein